MEESLLDFIPSNGLYPPSYFLEVCISNYENSKVLRFSVGPADSIEGLPKTLRELIFNMQLEEIETYCRRLGPDYFVHIDIWFRYSDRMDDNGIHFFRSVKVSQILKTIYTRI